MERVSERQNGYIPQRWFKDTSVQRDSDVNFSDVFGGPPRRSSMYEIRQRYSYAAVDDEEAVPYLSVFGGDSASSRRTGNDFFSDIFKGSKQQDPFSSAPRLLQDPCQFSLPTFGPPTRSSTRRKDPNQDKGGHLKDGSKVSTDASQFHFSIYKWASKGVPLMGSNSLRLKETGKTSVSSSSKLSMSRSSSISSKDNDSHGISESSQMVVEKVITLSESTTLGTGRVDSVSADTVQKMKHDSHLKVGSGGKEALNPLKSHHLTVKAGESKGINESNKKASAEKSETVKKPNALTGTVAGKAGQAKVKEFANQEESSKPKTAVDSQSQSSSWKAIFRPQKEANPKLQFNLNMEKSLQHESITEPKKVEARLKQSDKSYSASKTENNIPSSNSSKPKNASVSTTVPDGSKTAVRDANESSQPNSVMREVPLEKNEKPQPGKDHEDMQAADAKIRKWSNGKEGNIRSLLSTLQYVLWAESGWKPVPLVDIVEGNAVKKAYQRALLRLHPDKLQQKGAASHQKYIAEKVFDILQEAWTQFNSMGSL